MSLKLPLRLDKTLAKKLIDDVDNFLFDCDGVIWNWPNPIPGSVECINKLKEMGKKCFFVTNNSTKSRKTLIEMFIKVGINNVSENEIICTAWILAGYLKSINFVNKAYVVGSVGITTELDLAGIKHIGFGSNNHEFPDPAKCDFKNSINLDPEVKCVVVGFDYYINYPKMLIATSYAVKTPDCLFIATNDDAVLPTGNDSKIVMPGTGTIVNALKTSIGREPILLGKPHKTMWDVLSKMHNLDPNRSCMIGDRLDTDIAFAANNSIAYSIAVLSGVTNETEIMNYYSLSIKNKNELESTSKYVPNFFANYLGDLLGF